MPYGEIAGALERANAPHQAAASLSFHLKCITGKSVKELSAVIRIFRPETALKGHDEIVRRNHPLASQDFFFELWIFSEAGFSKIPPLLLLTYSDNDRRNGVARGLRRAVSQRFALFNTRVLKRRVGCRQPRYRHAER